VIVPPVCAVVVREVDIWAQAIARFEMQQLRQAFSALSTDKKFSVGSASAPMQEKYLYFNQGSWRGLGQGR
jgi:hypothetical protein